MSRIIDKAGVEATLKRAARISISGSREDRNGNTTSGPAQIAMRIRNEVDIAVMNWATVEAFNNRAQDLKASLSQRGAWLPVKVAIPALVRDVIAALVRVTDNPGKNDDCETFCRLRNVIVGSTIEEIATSTGANETDVKAGLEYLRDRVPPDWAQGTPPPLNTELADLRDAFKPIRDRVLAHASDYSALDLRAEIPKTREFLACVVRLSDAACMACNVARGDVNENWQSALATANTFWSIVENGGAQTQSDTG